MFMLSDVPRVAFFTKGIDMNSSARNGLAAVGLMAAFFLSQSLATLIYGISTRDALSFVVVPFMLIVVSIAACAAPAWRATRIDPLVALRTE